MGEIKTEGDFSLKCSECGDILTCDSETLNFGIDDSEGKRVWHSASQEYNCENCKNLMEVQFFLTEYPPGQQEGDKTNKVHGGEIADKLNFWVEETEPPGNREQRLGFHD